MSKINVTDDNQEEASKSINKEDQKAELTVVSDTTKVDDYSTEEEEENEGWLKKLQGFFDSKLKLEDVPQILDEVSIDGIVSYINSGECKNIITMAGAGISTSAGIPDFRSPDSGLYTNLAKYNLPHPEAIFDIDFFKSNPKPFFVLVKELYPGAFNPTPSHYFIKLLHEKDLLLRHYTQNVDTLEHIAGIPVEKLVEAHGTFRTSHCLSCKKSYHQQWMKEQIFGDTIPTCTVCSGVVKPDIVFFKESLPSRFFDLMQTDFKRCDLLIIMGTSLTVHPFASLVDNVSLSCPRLLINREDVSDSDPLTTAFQSLSGRTGLNLSGRNNRRDVGLIGDCDEGCQTLVKKLGWEIEFEKLTLKSGT